MKFILCQIETVTKLADHMEGKTDRWFVIFMAAIMIMATFVCGRWLVGRFEKVTDKLEASNESHAATIAQLCREAHSVNRELAVSLNRNTIALEEGIEERRKIREALEKLHQKI